MAHGLLLLVDPSIGDSHKGHGIVMPSCIHRGQERRRGGDTLSDRVDFARLIKVYRAPREGEQRYSRLR
jgi:hypothetical protein